MGSKTGKISVEIPSKEVLRDYLVGSTTYVFVARIVVGYYVCITGISKDAPITKKDGVEDIEVIFENDAWCIMPSSEKLWTRERADVVAEELVNALRGGA